MAWIDEQAEPQPRRQGLRPVAAALLQRHRHNRVGDMLLNRWQDAGLLTQTVNDLGPVELGRQSRIDNVSGNVPLALPPMKGRQLQGDMRRYRILMKAGHPLARFGIKTKPFGHQRSVKTEIGGHATFGINRQPSGLKKSGNTGIALADRHQAPGLDQPGHDHRRIVLGNPVGKNLRRWPVAIAKRQRRCRFAGKRHDDIEAFKLPAKGGGPLDIAVVILCQERLLKKRGIT